MSRITIQEVALSKTVVRGEKYSVRPGVFLVLAKKAEGAYGCHTCISRSIGSGDCIGLTSKKFFACNDYPDASWALIQELPPVQPSLF